MSFFAVTAVGGTGLGPAFAGWIEMNPKLGWRWIQWIQMMWVGYFWRKIDVYMHPFALLTDPFFFFFLWLFSICAAWLVLLPFVMKETRASVLLTRIAKKLRKETGDHRFRARVEDERAKLSTLIWISCTRPVRKSDFSMFFSVNYGQWLICWCRSFRFNVHRDDRVQFQRKFYSKLL